MYMSYILCLRNNFCEVLAKECILEQNVPKLNVVVSSTSHAIVFG